MDLHASDSASQKTSPIQDPAAMHHLASELTTQANILASHQQQLVKLTTLTEQLVKSVQLLTPPAGAAAIPSAESDPSPPVVGNSSNNPRLSLPEKYDGCPSKCKGFLLQCSIFINQQPQFYQTDDSRISFICSLLTGRALEWATALWEGGNLSFPSYHSFMQQFKEVFEHPAGGK